MSRTRNASRNIFFGFLQKMYQTLMPFGMRTLMIYSLGVEYIGLSGLFASVLQVLNIAELGMSSAITVSMYGPIANGDTKKICALLKLYRRCYFFIGLVILFAGGILIPFLPHLISGEVPDDINIYYLFLMYLGATVLSFWLFSYRSSLFEAQQRNDIISKINIFSVTVQFVLQIIILVFLKDYYLYLAVQFVVQLMGQGIVYFYAKKMYPEFRPNGSLDEKTYKTIMGMIKDLATAKFGAVILTSSDSIIISMFLGLTVLAIYQNYFFLITAVTGFVGTIMFGTFSGIGDSIVSESREKNFNDFKCFTFIISWIVCICTSCFLCLFQPFMKIWMGEDRILSFSIVILFCIYFFLFEYNQLFNLYKDAAGLWHKDRFRPFITSVVNLLLNILLIRHIGVYGVLLSTVLSMLIIGMPWLLHNIFSTLFEQRIGSYIKELLRYVMITACACTLAYFSTSCLNVSGMTEIIVKALIAAAIPGVIYALVFRKTEYFVYIADKLRYLIRKE